MITKDKLKKGDENFEQKKTVSIFLEDGRVFTIERDYLKYNQECGDHDKFDFDCQGCKDNKFFDSEYSEEEKQDIMNLYNNDEFDEFLEWD